MIEAVPGGGDESSGPPVGVGSPLASEPWVSRREMRFAVIMVAILAFVGEQAGLVWTAWAHRATGGYVIAKNAIVPDQSEGFISSDGRFVVITAAIGLIAGALAWTRRRHRGPATIAALGIGCVVGAVITDLVGRLAGGGESGGAVDTSIARLPLQVHASGCLFIEAIAALVVYLVLALMVRPDDLGRPTPDAGPGEQPAAGPPAEPAPSVGGRLDLERTGGDRHAASAGQQHGFAPQ